MGTEWTWYVHHDDDGQRTGATGEADCLVVAEIRYAQPGEVEGGLGALLRFMLAAKGLEAPPPSPGGWYGMGTWEERGVWERTGPFQTYEEALVAVREEFARGGLYGPEEA